jgi:hypothetical protein
MYIFLGFPLRYQPRVLYSTRVATHLGTVGVCHGLGRCRIRTRDCCVTEKVATNEPPRFLLLSFSNSTVLNRQKILSPKYNNDITLLIEQQSTLALVCIIGEIVQNL